MQSGCLRQKRLVLTVAQERPAKCLAAAHATSAAHLLRHAAPQRDQETRCLGRPHVLDPLLRDDVTQPATPPSPASSGYRASLPPSRDFECCTWSGRRTCRWLVPSPRNALTNVTSIASWAPRNRVNPSATTSNRLPSTPENL